MGTPRVLLPLPPLLLLSALGCDVTPGDPPSGGSRELSDTELGCGLPRPLPQPRSVGGSEAGEGRWPWQGSLRRGGSHVCGVSLVAPQWVLTAAHCLQGSSDPRLFSVLLGTAELDRGGEGRGGGGAGVSIPLSLLLPHPSYAGEATSGDLALARLARPVRFGPGLGPVCLPSPTLRFPPGTRCVSTGWGEVRPGESPRRLRQLEVPLLPLGLCRRLYGTDLGPALPPRPIQPDMLCAGHPEGGKDTWLSPELQAVLAAMLDPDPRLRPSAPELLGGEVLRGAGRWRPLTRLADLGLRLLEDWLEAVPAAVSGFRFRFRGWVWGPRTPPRPPRADPWALRGEEEEEEEEEAEGAPERGEGSRSPSPTPDPRRTLTFEDEDDDPEPLPPPQ